MNEDVILKKAFLKDRKVEALEKEEKHFATLYGRDYDRHGSNKDKKVKSLLRLRNKLVLRLSRYIRSSRLCIG
jgi:hypothetical protein